jgi:Putative Actinobacterial Holin-X, holin superfamily III
MADPAVRRTSSGVTDQSIGDLVSVAARDISQLVRYELDLAKLELKQDAKRFGIGAGLLIVALFAICLLLMLLCFAFAFGLHAVGAPGGLWGAFLWVALTCLVLIVCAGLIGLRMVRKLGGLPKTRRSMAESASLLHRGESGTAAKAPARAD